MEKVARFLKVSLKQFSSDAEKNLGITDCKEILEELKLPKRATIGSAGYDFYSPIDFTLKAGEEIIIPTGIRSEIFEGFVLMIFPRSGLGFKYRLTLNNTVGIIDSDYFYSDNEGHIMIKMTNCSWDKTIEVKKGQGFAQGIFLPFGITTDDETTEKRNGGFGSTTK